MFLPKKSILLATPKKNIFASYISHSAVPVCDKNVKSWTSFISCLKSIPFSLIGSKRFNCSSKFLKSSFAASKRGIVS